MRQDIGVGFNNDVFAGMSRLEQAVNLGQRLSDATYNTETIADVENGHSVLAHDTDMFAH